MRSPEVPVLAAAREDALHPAAPLREQRIVAQEMRQRDEPVQVVRAALPVLAVPAKPGTVRPDIRPDRLEHPGQAARLERELVGEPAARSHGAERQLTERGRGAGSRSAHAR